jgi:hypothetical protein
MLVEPDSVLDLDARLREASATNTPATTEVRTNMFDPAALGTLMIGLEANRREGERPSINPRPTRSLSRRTGARQRLAATLRWTAARLEPASLPAG